MSISIIASGAVSAAGCGGKEILNSFIFPQSLAKVTDFKNTKIPVFQLSPSSERLVEQITRTSVGNKRKDPSVLYVLAALQNMLDTYEVDFSGKGLICIGTSRGNTTLNEKFFSEYLNNRNGISVYASPLTTFGSISSEVASYLDLSQAVCLDSAQTCSSAFQAVLNGIAWLNSGMADWVIAGGTEAPLTPYTFAQVQALGIYSKEPTKKFPCRPFEVSQLTNSFVLGEGASVVVLRKSSSQKSRLAEIFDIASCYKQTPTLTGIDIQDSSLADVIEKIALAGKARPDVVITHAPGTLKGDKAEFNAIESVYKNKRPYVFSTKYMFGHTYGASAALSMAVALECLRQSKLPEVPYEMYFTQTPPKDINLVQINSTGFGGCSVSILLSR